MGWFRGASAQQKTKVSFLSNLRFRTKIMLGFMTVLGISAINMGVAYFGFELILLASAAIGIGCAAPVPREPGMDEAETQAAAGPNAAAPEQAETAARAAEANLGNAIESAARVATADNRKSVLNLSASYSEFSALFADVIKLKTENAAIASNQLLRMGNVIRYKFDDLADTAILDGQSSGDPFGCHHLQHQQLYSAA